MEKKNTEIREIKFENQKVSNSKKELETKEEQ